MQIYNTLCSINAQSTAVALGYFDGVHLGHRNVLMATQKLALEQGLQSAVFTFSLPENSMVKGNAILTETEKQRRIKKLGIQHYFCAPFLSFCCLTPKEFVEEILIKCLHAKQVFCGDNFTFGAKKSGNIEVLKQLCAPHNIKVNIVPMAEYHHATVSSTNIRSALLNGEIESVNAMLGQPYSVDFAVTHGKKLGRTMGFPTINQLYTNGMLIPKSGVYITRAKVGDTWYPSATGLGTRPTVGGEGITCETFIANYNGDLYGDEIMLEFYKYWNPVVKFNSLDELREYINNAAKATVEYFKA